jgi:hypothetical protein
MKLKVNYSPETNISFFVNCRHLLNAESREGFGIDKPGELYSGAVSFTEN